MNKTEIKTLVKESEMRISKDCYDEIESRTKAMLLDGIERAKANKRQTLKPYDL